MRFQKPAFLLLLCLMCLSNLAAQSQLIPYRVANKWGLADTLGKMVLPAIYDEVQFSLYKNDYSFYKVKTYNLPWNVFYVKKDQLVGIAGAKEIIKPIHSKITCIEQAYYLAFSNNDYAQIYNLKARIFYQNLIPTTVKYGPTPALNTPGMMPILFLMSTILWATAVCIITTV